MAESRHSSEEQFVDDLLQWSEGNLRSFPWRDLDASPYEVLIAEIFLKQTRSETVERILPEFLHQFPNPGNLVSSRKEEIVDIIRPLGLYNDRSEALLAIGRRIESEGVPETYDALLELPQVGPYVANATLCFAFDEPRPIVDSNIKRIFERLLRRS